MQKKLNVKAYSLAKYIFSFILDFQSSNIHKKEIELEREKKHDTV